MDNLNTVVETNKIDELRASMELQNMLTVQSIDRLSEAIKNATECLIRFAESAKKILGDESSWIVITSKETLPKDTTPVLIECMVVSSDHWWVGKYHIAQYDNGWVDTAGRELEKEFDLKVIRWRPIPEN